MKKKYLAVLAVVLGSIGLIGSSIAFAYYMVGVGGSGNTTNNQTTITTVKLGSIVYNGEQVFTSSELYPGMMGIQKFTIGPDTQEGTGTYQINLDGTLPNEFGTDIEITLYKTTNPSSNNVSITSGEFNQANGEVYQEDTLNVVGSPEIVYGPTALEDNDKIVLEKTDFDTTTLQETTYYLVYKYKNNGNQDSQMGKTFSGKVTVEIVTGNSGPTGSDILADKLPTSNDMITDEAGNIRYIGADPNNYVNFNGEKWRIIGVFDIAENETDYNNGKTEKRIKLIRDSIGTYTWDSSSTSTSNIQYGNNGNGINQWGASTTTDSKEYLGADIMQTLNSTYLTGGIGICYGGNNLSTKECIFGTESGQIKPLSSEAQSLVDNAVWNTGTLSQHWGDISSTAKVADFYTAERSSNNGKLCTSGTNCTDKVNRTTLWTGLVGLMYPSDYGYATSGGGTTDREICLNTALYNWMDYDNYEPTECATNSWLYDSVNHQWTMTPVLNSSHANNVFVLARWGNVNNSSAGTTASSVRPTVYLDADVMITGTGDGSYNNSYDLSI